MPKVTPEIEDLLRRAYAAFNARDIDAALDLMHPDVDWPNVIDGTRIHGHAAVRDYWERQFASIDVHVEPQSFSLAPDGSVVAEVHQLVRDRTGVVTADRRVQHVYRFRDGLVAHMEVRPS